MAEIKYIWHVDELEQADKVYLLFWLNDES